MKEPKILYADIETSLCKACVFSCGKQRINPNQILEPSRIVTIQYAIDDGPIHSITWDSKKSDKKMLQKFRKVMDQVDMVVGYNYNNFDVKVINTRLAFHNLPQYDLYTVEDLYRAVKRKFKLPSFSLDYLCTYFGMPAKFKHRGLELWKDVTFGTGKKYKAAMKEMEVYGCKDVEIMRDLFKRLKPHLDLKFNYASFNGDHTICPSCGSKDTVKCGHYMSSPLRKVLRAECKSCNKKFSYGVNAVKHTSEYGR